MATDDVVTAARRAIAIAVLWLLAGGFAAAHPTSPAIPSGGAVFTQNGDVLTVTSDHNTIIDWDDFSSGVVEVDRFAQPTASSAVLNRVVGANPSTIDGTISSNGEVLLINPNGVHFSGSSRVEAGGLTVSTFSLGNFDFLTGARTFSPSSGLGVVLNDGHIEIANGGALLLVAPQIVNSGSLVATGGSIVLRGDVVTTGVIRAEGGSISIYGDTLSLGGSIAADSLSINSGGTGPIGLPIVPAGNVVVLANSSNLAIEIGGLIPGSEYGQVSGGSIALQGGSLTIAVADDFLLQAGDSFQILTTISAGSGVPISLTGTFGHLDLPVLTIAGLVWDTSTLYSDGRITVLGSVPVLVVPEPATGSSSSAG